MGGEKERAGRDRWALRAPGRRAGGGFSGKNLITPYTFATGPKRKVHSEPGLQKNAKEKGCPVWAELRGWFTDAGVVNV